MIDLEKLKILTDGAKFDVSCSSSGSNRKNVNNGVGNAYYGGICHSFTEGLKHFVTCSKLGKISASAEKSAAEAVFSCFINNLCKV